MIFFGNFFAYVYSLHRSYGQVLIFWAIISSPILFWYIIVFYSSWIVTVFDLAKSRPIFYGHENR